MAQPIDYLGMLPRVDLGQSLMRGLQIGGEIKKIGEENRAAELQAQYAADLQQYMQNPTARGAANLTLKYPQIGDAVKQSYGMLSDEQKDNEFSQVTQVFTALKNNRPDVANTLLDRQIEAAKNSGEDPSYLMSIKDGIANNPTASLAIAGQFGAAADPERWDKFIKASSETEMAPANLSEAQAKAYKAGVDAKFAESQAALEIEQKGWNIQKIMSDIQLGKQNARIAAMDAALKREGNDLKRAELQQKLDDAQTKRDDALRAKVADVESGRMQMDNMLNTADRILKTPIDTIEWATGAVGSKLPTLDTDTADFEALIETLGSQSFMAQIPNIKGMGQLSNAEGEKLQAALQNLSLRQSPKRLTENVREAQRLILKARENVSKRYGVPDTIPDTPASQPAADEIGALLQKYGQK